MFVRTVAGGNETVPTVRVGPVAAVNPSAAAVVDMVREHAPSLLAGWTVQRASSAVTTATPRRGARRTRDYLEQAAPAPTG